MIQLYLVSIRVNMVDTLGGHFWLKVKTSIIERFSRPQSIFNRWNSCWNGMEPTGISALCYHAPNWFKSAWFIRIFFCCSLGLADPSRFSLELGRTCCSCLRFSVNQAKSSKDQAEELFTYIHVYLNVFVIQNFSSSSAYFRNKI